jgi:hypothetical protein
VIKKMSCFFVAILCTVVVVVVAQPDSSTLFYSFNGAFAPNLYIPPANTGVAMGLAPLTDLRDVNGVTNCVLNGQSIMDNIVSRTFNWIKYNNSYATFEAAFADGRYTKAIRVRLVITTSGVVGAQQLAASYGSGDTLASFSFAALTSGMVQGMAGYGLLSFALTRALSTPVPPPILPNVALFKFNPTFNPLRYVRPDNVLVRVPVEAMLPPIDMRQVVIEDAVLCVRFPQSTVVVRCALANVTETEVKNATMMQFVVAVRDSDTDKRVQMQVLLVPDSADVQIAAKQLGQRMGTASTPPGALFAQLPTPPTPTYFDFGVITFNIRASPFTTTTMTTTTTTVRPTPIPPTPLPTPVRTPAPAVVATTPTSQMTTTSMSMSTSLMTIPISSNDPPLVMNMTGGTNETLPTSTPTEAVIATTPMDSGMLGALIGGIVGGAICLILLIVLVVLLVRRRRREPMKVASPVDVSNASNATIPIPSATTMSQQYDRMPAAPSQRNDVLVYDHLNQESEYDKASVIAPSVTYDILPPSH